MATEELTEKQKNVLCAIEIFINKKGYSPTVRELGDLLGLKSTASIQRHLDILEQNEYISREKGSSRTIRVLKNINIIQGAD